MAGFCSSSDGRDPRGVDRPDTLGVVKFDILGLFEGRLVRYSAPLP
jgi:hypothetical protein